MQAFDGAKVADDSESDESSGLPTGDETFFVEHAALLFKVLLTLAHPEHFSLSLLFIPPNHQSKSFCTDDFILPHLSTRCEQRVLQKVLLIRQ